MNPLSAIMFVAFGAALWVAPRNWTLVPFIAGCCLVTSSQGIELGFISLPIYRLLMLIGVARVVSRGETIVGGLNAVDKMLIAWAAWYAFSSLFHDWELDAGPVYVCGVIYNMLVFYFLARAWISSLDDTYTVIRITALLLVPIALEMTMEKVTGKNLFSYFGGVPENVAIREGKLRAQGPFLHPILAGTVGATCIPWFVGILKQSRVTAMIGIAAGFVMVMASASSGPIMSLMAACFALLVWKIRSLTRMMRIAFFLTYLLLMVVMERPPYYLISKIDLSGGSTGWHRSFLIENTIRYFNEWWLFGTDYTIHWMPFQGLASSPTHTDITNYYIGIAVGGGLPAMLLILGAMCKSLFWVGKLYRVMLEKEPQNAFMIWCFGSALFAHMVTGISVSYFDQSVVFLWLNVAVIASMYSATFDGDGLREEPVESQTTESTGQSGLARS